MSKELLKQVTTRVPFSVVRGLNLLTFLRDERSGSLRQTISGILYPSEADLSLQVRLCNLPIVELPEPDYMRPINFNMFAPDRRLAKAMAETKKVTEEVLFTSFFAGYLATEEVRNEMITGLNTEIQNLTIQNTNKGTKQKLLE